MRITVSLLLERAQVSEEEARSKLVPPGVKLLLLMMMMLMMVPLKCEILREIYESSFESVLPKSGSRDNFAICHQSASQYFPEFFFLLQPSCLIAPSVLLVRGRTDHEGPSD